MAEVKNICLEALERHCRTWRHGRLDFRRGTYEGQIFTDDACIVHAQIAGLEGIPALFRLFDWGDAETTWQPGITPEQADAAPHHGRGLACSTRKICRTAPSWRAADKERIDQAFSRPKRSPGQAGGIESVLKHYTISLECTDPTLLPGGFTFSDATKSSYVIGSSEDCDVVLDNPTVDPLHCGVILEHGSVLIWDLGAQSGVKINGNPVDAGHAQGRRRDDAGRRWICASASRLRRPTIKPKPTGRRRPRSRRADPAIRPPARCPCRRSPRRPRRKCPRAPITYDKVAKQLQARRARRTPSWKNWALCLVQRRNKLGSPRIHPDLRAMHILLIDDSSSTRSLLRTLINSGQTVRHEISEAASGEEALQKVGSGEINLPDLIIMDINMGGMSGYEFCREFRQRHGTASDVVPYIIIVTANEGVDVINQALDCGANDYMPKPVNVKILQVRLRVAERLLAHAHARASAPAARRRPPPAAARRAGARLAEAGTPAGEPIPAQSLIAAAIEYADAPIAILDVGGDPALVSASSTPTPRMSADDRSSRRSELIGKSLAELEAWTPEFLDMVLGFIDRGAIVSHVPLWSQTRQAVPVHLSFYPDPRRRRRSASSVNQYLVIHHF